MDPEILPTGRKKRLMCDDFKRLGGPGSIGKAEREVPIGTDSQGKRKSQFPSVGQTENDLVQFHSPVVCPLDCIRKRESLGNGALDHGRSGKADADGPGRQTFGTPAPSVKNHLRPCPRSIPGGQNFRR